MTSDFLPLSASDPAHGATPEMVVVPRTRDLGGGFAVRRVLPARERRMVGPFIFLDHIGPTVLRAGTGFDVAPHPHIGLATVTYLFAGELLHRDNLGSAQVIRPGAVNWMTAGRGIAHSERTPPQRRVAESEIFGIQTWVALPRAQEEIAPSFAHHPAEDLPVLEGEGIRLRLVAGELYGRRAPVAVLSSLFYADAALEVDATLGLPPAHEERSAYIVSGRVASAGETFESGRLLVFRRGETAVLTAVEPARLILLGGEPMDGPRHIWWNFVASSMARIELAKEDWKAGRFTPIPSETGFIPLPN